MWDLHLGIRTQEAIDAGYRSRVIDEFQDLAMAQGGHIAGMEGEPFCSTGFIINCPIVARRSGSAAIGRTGAEREHLDGTRQISTAVRFAWRRRRFRRGLAGTAALAVSPRYPHNVLPDGQASVNQPERHAVMGRLLAAST